MTAMAAGAMIAGYVDLTSALMLLGLVSAPVIAMWVRHPWRD